MDEPPTPRASVIAALEIAAVVALLLTWLWTRLDARLLPRAHATDLATVVHVALTGALAMGLVAVATWRDASRVRALGLSRTPLGAAIGWGLLGVVASYALSTIAVGIYFAVSWFVSTIPSAGAHLVVPVLPGGAPDGVLGRELTNKAAWASELARIPLAWALPVAIFAGVYEEILFRGFVLGRLRVALGRLAPRTRDVLAVLVSAVLFAAGHGYQGGLGLAQTFAAGVVLASLTLWRGSLWPAIVTHVAIDAFGLVAIHALHSVLERMLHAR